MWRDQECKPNRDYANNVCCRPEDVSTNCLHLLAGECPPGWRVARECCPAPYDKWVSPCVLSKESSMILTNVVLIALPSVSIPRYADRLDTGDPDLVCCNAPCTAIELAWAGNETLGIEANSR